MQSTPDEYQERYLAHQARKKNVLLSIMKERHSNRVFADKEVPQSVIESLIEAAQLCPSSCDRHGIQVKAISTRDEKALLGGLLVGGVGWIHRAPTVLMLFGDPIAYKAGSEADYMPYIDAGVVVQQMFLAATAEELHACYCNPNVRPMNRAYFASMFGYGIFCGALAIGWPPNEEG